MSREREVDYALYESLFKSKRKISISVGMCSVKGLRPTMEDEHLDILHLDAYHKQEFPNFKHMFFNGIASPYATSESSSSRIRSSYPSTSSPHVIRSPHMQSSASRRKTPGRSHALSEAGAREPALKAAICVKSPFKVHSMFGVFDGHSGKDAATFCKKNLFHHVYKNSNYFTNVDRALKEGFLECDLALRKTTESPRAAHSNQSSDRFSGAGHSAGCTACVCIIRDSELIVANAGDSRAVLAHSGKSYAMSEDHKPIRHDEKKRIEAAGGVVMMGRVNGTLAVSRGFGDFQFKQRPGRYLVIAEPEIRRATIKKNTDFMIIACDGLWDVINSKEIVKYCYPLLLQYKDANIVCEKLVEKALNRRSMDNITVMLILFHELNK